MLMQVLMAQGTLEELVEQILLSRKITRLNQQQLMSALLSKDSLNERERNMIDRVFSGVRLGVLRVVD